MVHEIAYNTSWAATVAAHDANGSGDLDSDVFTATVAVTLTGLRASSGAGDITALTARAPGPP